MENWKGLNGEEMKCRNPELTREMYMSSTEMKESGVASIISCSIKDTSPSRYCILTVALQLEEKSSPEAL